MSFPHPEMIPYRILHGRSSVRSYSSGESPAASELVASAALATTLFPVFLYYDVSLAVAAPLSLLAGMTAQHVFRLVFRPVDSDVFSPGTLVAIYFIIYFLLRSLILSTVPFFGRVGRNPYDDYIPAALWCACAGYFSFLWGMSSRVAQRWVKRLPAPTGWPRAMPAARILCLMVIGLGCLIYLFKIGMAVGNFGNREFERNPPPGVVVLLENLIDLSWIAICMYLVPPKRKSGSGVAWLLLGTSLGILCIKLAITGGKTALIQPLMEAAIVFHYVQRRFRIWEVVSIGVPVVLVAFGIVNFYRFVVVGQHGSPKSMADVVSRVSTASDLLKAQSESADRKPAFQQMVERNAGVDAFALIMKYTPRPFPYVYGVHWMEVPLTFVPRQIWRDKPVNMPSAEFENTYMGMPSNFNGFSSMQLIGDLYRNFSFAGVLGGMFLLGILLRLFYLVCSPSRENGTGLFLYAALFPEIIHSLETDVGYAIINVVRAAALAIVVAVLLGVRFKKPRQMRLASRSRRPEVGRYGHGIVAETAIE